MEARCSALSHDLVVPHALQTPDALDGDFETPHESPVSVNPAEETEREYMEEMRSLFGARLDDKTIGVDESCPNPSHKVPGEMIVRDQIREYIVHILTVEHPVRETPKQRTREVERWRRSGLQNPTCNVNGSRFTCETVLRKKVPFFPTGPGLADIDWVALTAYVPGETKVRGLTEVGNVLRSLYDLGWQFHSTDGEKVCVKRWSSAVGRTLYGREGNSCRRPGGVRTNAVGGQFRAELGDDDSSYS